MNSDSLSLLSPNNESIPIHTNEEEEEETPKSTIALLSFNTDSSPANPSNPAMTTPLILTSLLFTTSLALLAATLFASLYFSSDSSQVSRSLKKLKQPVVLLISSDGFRFGFQYKVNTPNIDRLIKNGTEADLGLIPVFPSLTFPNHYSIVTGMYPAYHGIVNNFFIEPNGGDYFTMQNHDPKWWLAEPLWETVVKHGLQAATYFWPGSEVKKGHWTCPDFYCKRYNSSVGFQDRVDAVLNYFDLPSVEIPSFMTLYFEDPDHQGHKFGPDAPQITEAVTRIDRMVGRLIQGLETRGVFEDVNIIMVGDHGMVGTCDEKLIFLDDLGPWIQISKDWVQSYSPLLAIQPPSNYSAKEVVAKMNEGLQSGKVGNGQYLKVYLKEELPGRLHYTGSDRIPPVIGLPDEAFKVGQKNTNRKECGGSHGYDNAFFSMRSIFIGHGPRFARGHKVSSFENVEIYNLVTKILGLEGSPNNGTTSFPDTVILPIH